MGFAELLELIGRRESALEKLPQYLVDRLGVRVGDGSLGDCDSSDRRVSRCRNSQPVCDRPQRTPNLGVSQTARVEDLNRLNKSPVDGFQAHAAEDG